MRRNTKAADMERRFTDVDRHMNRAVEEGVFPCAVLLAAVGNYVFYHKGYGKTPDASCDIETVFDLASLTKPLATTPAIFHLAADHRLSLDAPLERLLPEMKGTDKAEVTILHLLCHRSGLPDYRPYYKELIRYPMRERPAVLRKLLAAEPLVNDIGDVTAYSDLGFMVLARVVERLSGMPLDRYVTESVYGPLEIEDLFFLPIDGVGEKKFHVAPTEDCPWRKTVIRGAVHDDNAWVLGGVDGHAGLFGTASGVFRMLRRIVGIRDGDAFPDVLPMKLVKKMFEAPAGWDRPLGLDVPTPPKPSCGRYFLRRSVGHLGFTGTSFWMDPEREATVILLSNRVNPDRNNIRIRDFRPVIHDAVMAALGFGGTP